MRYLIIFPLLFFFSHSLFSQSNDIAYKNAIIQIHEPNKVIKEKLKLFFYDYNSEKLDKEYFEKGKLLFRIDSNFIAPDVRIFASYNESYYSDIYTESSYLDSIYNLPSHGMKNLSKSKISNLTLYFAPIQDSFLYAELVDEEKLGRSVIFKHKLRKKLGRRLIILFVLKNKEIDKIYAEVMEY